MTLYVDTSALLKRYVDEPDSELFRRHLTSDQRWVTGRHTSVEIRRNLPRLLRGAPLRAALGTFESDWRRTYVVELDRALCDLAGNLAELTGARTLDALHLAAAQRAGGGELPLLTADLRQALVARELGWTVLST